MSSPSSSGRATPPEGTRGAREAIELVGLIVAPVTLIGALLFYFGWARSRAQAAYFGIDVDLLGRSSQEYALRSIGSVFWPLALILTAILVAHFTHGGAKRLAAAGQARPLLLLAFFAIVIGVALVVLGVLGVVWHPRAGRGAVFTPAALAVGIPVVAYAVSVALSVASSREAINLAYLPRAPLLLIAGLSSVFVFWAIGAYADLRGRRLAELNAAHLYWLPSVIVYSPKRLYLEGDGVTETVLTAPNSAYRFRYSGLRLYARAGDRTFLVPFGWCRKDHDRRCRRNGVTFVLKDNDALRLDFAP